MLCKGITACWHALRAASIPLPNKCWCRACAGQENAQLTAELATAKQQAQQLLLQQQASQQQVAHLQQQLAACQQECSTLRAALAAAERDFRAALERNASLVQAEVQHMQEVLQVGGLGLYWSRQLG